MTLSFVNNCCEDKFQSISFCYKPHIEVTHFEPTIGASLIEFKKLSFSQNSFRLFIVYRKNRTSLTSFYDLLTQMKQFNIHIFLGDFNINAQDSSNSVSQVLENYQQLVQEPTHIAGAILDHVYVRNDIIGQFNIRSFVNCLHFSDHEWYTIYIFLWYSK